MFALNELNNIKNYTCYTQNEILELVNKCQNDFELSTLIDRLYIYKKNKRNTKNSYEYSILTTRTLYTRETLENNKLNGKFVSEMDASKKWNK